MQDTNTVVTALNIDENFNLFKTLSLKENIQDPYPVYHSLREYDPVFFMKSPTGFLSENIWILTRYDHISSVLINKKFGRGNRFGKTKITANYAKLNSLTQMRQHWINFLDPPDHTRIRGFINKAFSPKMVNELKPGIDSVVNYLMDKFQGNEAEFISEFSYPLAAITIAEFYGIPKEDRDILDKWAMQIVKTLDVVTNQFTQDDLKNIYRCADEIKDYFRKQVEEKERNPKDDMISRLLTIEDKGDRLTIEEIIASLVLMIMDAHEAPKNMISNGLYALLKNPEQYEKLKKDPSLTEGAVDELLRYDSPAQFTGRRTHEDEIVGGKEIKKGLQIICMLGAGNRDPLKFSEPDRLDIERKNVIPLSFGGGIHFCAGAGFAKLEAVSAFENIARNFPDLKLKDKEYHYHDSLHSRGLESLDVYLK
ncbi:MAG: cytochrome P450 [Ignavibacteria bacterium]|nr:cytochrome P450 [Ignavibacteria bacterium]